MSQNSSFRICPECKAYNTIHVLRCYKCGFDLPRPDTKAGAGRMAEDGKYKSATSDTRQAERRALGVLGAVLEVNGEIRHDILIENISSGGLLFHSDWDYQQFDRFRILVPLEAEHYVVEATVRRCQSAGFSQWPFTVGIEFVDPDPAFTSHVLCLSRAGLYSFV